MAKGSYLQLVALGGLYITILQEATEWPPHKIKKPPRQRREGYEVLSWYQLSKA